MVDGPDDTGTRAVSVFSRAEPGLPWLLHAEGALSAGTVQPTADLSMWPPVGATPMALDGIYQELAARGYGYGPAFQGLQAMWRRGDELFAEVALPTDAGLTPAGFGVHPAVLDAALHAVIVASEHRRCRQGSVMVPFSWQQVSLHAAGASAVRARIAPTGPSAVSIELTDTLGLPVLSVSSMVARPVTEKQLKAALSGAGGDRLFEVVWTPTTGASAGAIPSYEVFESEPATDDPVADVYAATHKALAAVGSWLTERDTGVLVVAT